MSIRRATIAIASLAALCAAGLPTAAAAQEAAPEKAPEAANGAALNVRATATFEARPDAPSADYAAKVFVDGAPVGPTPYSGALAPGEHLVEIEGDGLRASTVIVAVAGRTYSIHARFSVPLTQAERQEREAKARAEAAAEKAAADAEWNAIRSAWQEQDAAVRAKRKAYVASGAVLLPVGLCLIIAGSVAAGMARDEDDKYLEKKDEWEHTTDPQRIEELKEDMAEAADARDANNTMGIAFLAVGGAAAVTGIVVLAVMPKRPPEPIRTLGGESPIAWSLAPLVGPDLQGLSLEARF